jgi:hypothetical protein
MTPDTVVLFAIFAVGAFVGMRLEGFLAKQRRAAWKKRNAGKWDKRGGDGNVSPFQPKADALPAKVPDAADQLRTVMLADFTAQPLLNNSEARLFKVLDKLVLEMRPGWQVMAQVSLGEILRCKDKAAYGCINSKRVDLLIVDADCNPHTAIEYQGGGHFKGAHATAARDAVKKEALRRAGIGYEEIVGGHHTPAELRRLIERLLKKPPN